jgi:hypothetical protein
MVAHLDPSMPRHAGADENLGAPINQGVSAHRGIGFRPLMNHSRRRVVIGLCITGAGGPADR